MKYGITIILTIGLLSACSSVKTMPEKESKTTNQNIQPTPGRPNLTAPEVLTKVLDFLYHAQPSEDFRTETTGKVMNLRLLEHTDGCSDFYIGNKFGDSDWIRSINFIKGQSEKTRLNFGDVGGYSSATPICQVDLDRFHPPLVKAGLIHTGKGHRGRPFNGYGKKYPNGYEVDLRVFYRGESAEKVLHGCINETVLEAFKPRW